MCPCVCRASRFKGFQQQDSQELLRYLLDGLRTEETSVSGLMVPSLCRLIRGTLQKLQKGKEAVGAACMLEGVCHFSRRKCFNLNLVNFLSLW